MFHVSMYTSKDYCLKASQTWMNAWKLRVLLLNLAFAQKQVPELVNQPLGMPQVYGWVLLIFYFDDYIFNPLP